MKHRVREQITNPQLDKILPLGDLKYPIGDIIPNWVFSSVSPLLNHKAVCRTALATQGLVKKSRSLKELDFSVKKNYESNI